MFAKLSFWLLSAILAALVTLGPPRSTMPVEAQEKRDPGRGDDKPVSIPKEQIYTTSSERGFKEYLRVDYEVDEKGNPTKPKHGYTFDLKAIREKHGPSTTFLIRGDDLATVMKSTRSVFVSSWSADRPPDQDIYGTPIASKKGWLVVFLGSTSSDPPEWTLKSCEVKGKVIEFNYEELHDWRGGRNADVIQYFYWVPLPPLGKGTYQLRLIDGRKKQPRLIRFVDFP